MDYKLIQDEVIFLTNKNDSCYKNDEQYCFACGLAMNILQNNYKKIQVTISNATASYIRSLNNNTVLSLKIKHLIKLNITFIENLPQRMKNIFAYIMAYEPNTKKMSEDMKNLLSMGSVVIINFN